MTAKIRGAIVTPDQKPVSVSIHATPIPEPSTGAGTVVIAGDIAIDQTSPINIDVIPGTYRLTVYAPTKMLTARSVALKDGDTLDLASILEAAHDPAGQDTGVALIDGDGKLIACANITVVHSRAEADALNDGTVYVLAASAPAPGGETPPHVTPPVTRDATMIVEHAAGQVAGDTITITLNGQAGDRVVAAINTKAIAEQVFEWPAGWTVLTEPYYVGTMRFTVAYGPWADTISVHTSTAVEAGWAACSIRSGGAPVAGTVKDRTKDPKETTTITAPTIDATTGLVLAFAFERTSKPETRDQVTVSTGWEVLDFAAQQDANYQTVLLARWVGEGTPTALTATYPNDQATNGAALQVVIPNA